MVDIRQSPQYAQFMKDLGWRVEKVGRWNAYIRHFPIIGSFIKIQKIQSPIPFDQIKHLQRKYKIVKLQVAPDIELITKPPTPVIPGLTGNPDSRICENDISILEKQFKKYRYRIDSSPNIPTQTIQIDLTQSENKLFNNLTEAKRRAVRRALKHKVNIKESHDIQSFIRIREKQHFPMGFLLVKEMNSLWKNFYPNNAVLLLAYKKIDAPDHLQNHAAADVCRSEPLAGILLLFYDSVAYYWYAASIREGKILFAPTILVWEAIKLAKKRNSKVFDFEGVYDERFPKATDSWKGFTRFKEGFGGKAIIYIGSFIKQ